MTKIAINNRNLHEVKMKQRELATGTISHISYPEHRIKTEVESNKIIVKLPPLLTLELYRSGIIPQNKEEAFPVRLDGKDIGLFRVIDLNYPQSLYTDELVSITITPIDDAFGGNILYAEAVRRNNTR